MQTNVAPVEPPDFSLILPNHGFVDAFATNRAPSSGNLLQQAQFIMGTAPRWVTTLMDLRNRLVKPLGLKTGGQDRGQAHIGMFPIISTTDEQVILGLDDKHLDFRLVLDRMPSTGYLRLSTAVRCRNIFGRVYLAVVMPFHKLIVPAMLRRAQ